MTSHRMPVVGDVVVYTPLGSPDSCFPHGPALMTVERVDSGYWGAKPALVGWRGEAKLQSLPGSYSDAKPGTEQARGCWKFP